MEGVGLPLLHALQLRPRMGAGQGVGEDLEEGEVLEAGAVPQLGEQVALLKQTQKRGLLIEKPHSLLSSWPTPSSGEGPSLPPQPCEQSPALETLRSRSTCSGCLRREDGAAVTEGPEDGQQPLVSLSQMSSRAAPDPYPASFPRRPGKGGGLEGQGETKMQAF